MLVKELDFKDIAGGTGGALWGTGDLSWGINYEGGYCIQGTASAAWIRTGVQQFEQLLEIGNFRRPNYRRSIYDYAAILTPDSLMIISPSPKWEDRVLAYVFQKGTLTKRVIRIHQDLLGEKFRELRDLARERINAGPQLTSHPLRV